MQTTLFFSIVIPVYNRPQEIRELLQSLTKQKDKNFEVIIVEDGSDLKCENELPPFTNKLDISYFFKPNSGPGLSRNYGFEKAKGNYIIFLDSDCILPEGYMTAVNTFLTQNYVEAFGGPDRAMKSFTPIQKAINYSMTSMLTTGGIRGGAEKFEKFHPRSFNMGCSHRTLTVTKGFSALRFGEDIDLSIRIVENNLSTALIKDAYVYHKRRSTLRQFFKQIFNSGIARINLSKRHPKSLKLVHFFPAIFIVGVFVLLCLAVIVSYLFLIPLLVLILLFFTDAFIKNKSIKIALLSIVTSFIQIGAYGLGFIKAFWKRNILKQSEFHAFRNNFYK